MMSTDRRELQSEYNGGLTSSGCVTPFLDAFCDLNARIYSHNWMIKESADNCLLTIALCYTSRIKCDQCRFISRNIIISVL
jgi:hypothetical protein